MLSRYLKKENNKNEEDKENEENKKNEEKGEIDI